jgi:hypothetical protein
LPWPAGAVAGVRVWDESSTRATELADDVLPVEELVMVLAGSRVRLQSSRVAPSIHPVGHDPCTNL